MHCGDTPEAEIVAVSEDDSLAALIRNLTPHLAKQLWEIRVCLRPELAVKLGSVE